MFKELSQAVRGTLSIVMIAIVVLMFSYCRGKKVAEIRAIELQERIGLINDTLQYYVNENNDLTAIKRTIEGSYFDVMEALEDERVKNKVLAKKLSNQIGKKTEAATGTQIQVRIVRTDTVTQIVDREVVKTDTVYTYSNDTVIKEIRVFNNPTYSKSFTDKHYSINTLLGVDTAAIDISIPTNIIVSQSWKRKNLFNPYVLQTAVTVDNPYIEVKDIISYKKQNRQRFELGAYAEVFYLDTEAVPSIGGYFEIGNRTKFKGEIGTTTKGLIISGGIRQQLISW